MLCAQTFSTFVYATSTALISLSLLLASQGWRARAHSRGTRSMCPTRTVCLQNPASVPPQAPSCAMRTPAAIAQPVLV